MYLKQEEIYAAILVVFLVSIMYAVIIKDIYKEIIRIKDKLCWIENFLMETRREQNESNSGIH